MLDKPEHKARLETVLNAISDSELRQWTKDSLQHSNDVTLQERLDELWDTAPSLIGELTVRDDFTKNVKKIRNMRTHISKGTITVPLSLEEMMDLTNHMLAFLWSLLIIELGFTEARAAKMLRRRFPPDRGAVLMRRLMDQAAKGPA